MKRTSAAIAALLLPFANGGEVPVTLEEMKIGVSKSEVIGAWKVRSGNLRKDAMYSFDAKDFGCRFAYATQTIPGNWTVGVRLTNETTVIAPGPSDYRNATATTRAAVPVYYFQGPEAIKTGGLEAIEFWTGKHWEKEQVVARKDGTVVLPAAMFVREKLFLKWRGENLTFDLKDFPSALAQVKAIREAEAQKEKAAPPPPPPR